MKIYVVGNQTGEAGYDGEVYWRMSSSEKVTREEATNLTQGDCLVLLRGLISSLHKAEQKVAEYILEHPEDVIYLPITELAERSGVSETTVVRLCRKLGLRGYQDLRNSLVRDRIEPLKNIHEAIKDEDDEATIARKVLTGHINSLEDTLKILDEISFKKAVEALSEARRIEFYGLGGSGAVAIDAQHKFLKTGIPCTAYIDAHMQAMSASILGPQDVVVGISHTGSTKDIVESLEIANKAGATTICITSYRNSPVTKVAKIKLFVASKEIAFRAEPLASRIAQLALIDALYVAVAYRRKEEALETLNRMREAIVNKRF